MPTEQISFQNSSGDTLSASLEIPSADAKFFALFAHCFTCSKNIFAARQISKRLVENGIGVLRFDFTGLGDSGGDFSDTNFSSNLDDLMSAARFLETNYTTPKLLIGHSLGGAAVLAAAQQMKEAKAIVTIGAPATAEHVQHLFSDIATELDDVMDTLVDIGGRKFKIKKQLLQDLSKYNTTSHLEKLGKALLIFHSPVDNIVAIDEAAKIYQSARHPKSFISLENADHLLSKKQDANYVADVMSSWISRYLFTDNEEVSTVFRPELNHGTVFIQEQNQRFTRDLLTDDHELVADEPPDAGGDNLGPDPYEYLLAALGSCTSMTIRMYANRKKLALDNVEVTLSHKRIHAQDCHDCEKQEGTVDVIDKAIKLEGNLSKQERTKLMEIADKCPVHKTLYNEIVIHSKLLD
ncbi:MAG: OsmC family protein [Gammaproteobacteria bacterium]|nr:OsmC family protein [Gammaproteobacteria bacterium]